MTTLVIDANVWVSAADATDSLSGRSRDFLSVVADQVHPIALPEFAGLEIACALSRRLRDAELGRALTDQMLRSPLITTYALNPSLLQHAFEVGTRDFLRAGDALYTALSATIEGELVSWDDELIQRSRALSPQEWLVRNARENSADSVWASRPTPAP